ncbi:zinc-dependent metalloprotease [Streptomyces sp. GbtcB6]|uniref:zinc-dependent metalloprotease n=1 Tax=Streptomyces sp. GbtcB6 TaxID=2824751 RepID=UPI001C30692F|nr:zinc-dependent metalloprotease [Streptomyces sp. GbtcB6]
MSTIRVTGETDHCEDLADQMADLLHTAAPYVEKATGLVLPDVSVRLVDIGTAAREFGAFVRHRFEHGTPRPGVSARERDWENVFVQGTEWTVRMQWATTTSLTIANPDRDGLPETLMVPATLAWQRLSCDRTRLCALMIEILTKQAQVAACGGSVIPGKGRLVALREQDPAFHLGEGHAQWTSLQVSPVVLSQPVRRRHQWHIDVVRASLAGDVGGARAWKRRATSFVDTVLAAVGTEVFNRMWVRHEMLPTLAELRHPARWIRRQNC